MPLTVQLDDIEKLVAQKAFGSTQADALTHAKTAVTLALQELQSKNHLISQEKEGTFQTTGMNTYSISSKLSPTCLRIVALTTPNGPLNIVEKSTFLIQRPNYADYASGIPTHAVLWAADALYIWPDMGDQTITALWYEMLDGAKAADVLWAVERMALRIASSKESQRGINRIEALEAQGDLAKGQTREVGGKIEARPPEWISRVHSYKRNR